MPDLNTRIQDAENRLLDELRRQHRLKRESGEGGSGVSVGQKVADAVAAIIGSWPFIIIQSCLLADLARSVRNLSEQLEARRG